MDVSRTIGAHVSVAKGLKQAVQNVIAMGGNALQIFSGSPRGWARKSLDQVNAEDFLAFRKEQHFGPVYIHALYLVNLVGENEALVNHSVESLIYDLKYSKKIHSDGVIVHLGSHLGNGYDAVFSRLVSAIQHILAETPKESVFLVENSAGQQGKLCSSFEDIARLFESCKEEVELGRLGLCVDTCHANSAGYRLNNLGDELTKHNLWKTLKVIHLNDSRDPFDSGRDRHENIGEGTIGKGAIRDFLHDPQFKHLPLILEVPGFDGNGPDAKNIEIVKQLLQ